MTANAITQFEREYLKYVRHLENSVQHKLLDLVDSAENTAYVEAIHALLEQTKQLSQETRLAMNTDDLSVSRDCANQWHAWQAYSRQLHALMKQERRLNGIIERCVSFPYIDTQLPLLLRLQQEHIAIIQATHEAADIKHLNESWMLNDVIRINNNSRRSCMSFSES